jgi:AcrR family transcriptional regulator
VSESIVADVRRTPPRRERSDAVENRRKLLVAAKTLFAVYGVDQTSMFEVARAAGVGQGTLYRHFAHKGKLCQALIRDDLDAFMARVDAAIDAPEMPASPLERLDALIVDQIRLVEQHLPLLATIEAAGTSQHRDYFQSPWYVWLRGHLARLLVAAAASGEIEPKLDPEFTADAIMAILAPRFVGHQRQDLSHDLDRIIAGMRHLFVEGIRSVRVSDPA